jgi:hypothetical protein
MPGQTRGGAGPGDGGAASSNVFLKKTIAADITVPADCVLLLHDFVLLDGATITVEDTGEVLVL